MLTLPSPAGFAAWLDLGNREAHIGRQRLAVHDQHAALHHLARRFVGVVLLRHDQDSSITGCSPT
jgi:hypothetical protein